MFLDQAKFALIGLPILFVLSRMPVRYFKRFAWPALGAAILFQLLVFTPAGLRASAATRTGSASAPITAQPSEAIKLALAVWLGAVLARKLPLLHQWRHALDPGRPGRRASRSRVVLAGHDLGTAMVLLLLVAGALFVAGVPLRMFGLAGAARRRR